MKNLLIYITLALLAFFTAFIIYKWMANEPILPTIEKVDFSPEYQIPYETNQGKG